ncbi:receptor-like protein kinase FERONIA [Impatiens glandulifera]|uniref:receptor-like protein kinase FERONIA n=1 Tax=Impatiens glandulifera TaxID=253017 RepID=UPI001FB0CD58|nr:receptor-like protein kinase FERONIA [Impatiens glandulifera]
MLWFPLFRLRTLILLKKTKEKMFLISRPNTTFTFLCFIHCYLVLVCLLWMVHGETHLPFHPTEIIAINCGSYGNSTSLDGRQWIGDATTNKFFDNGKSKSLKTVENALSAVGTPYSTARVSYSHFTYTFHSISGPMFIRLHFYPTSYKGFTRSNAFFTVKAGPYTLLSNFSPSLTAEAFGLKSIVKEFSLHVEENKPLRLTFSPSRTCSCDDELYAFVNGIEVVSMPNTLYYTPQGDSGASVVGHNRRFLIGNSFALETVHRLNIGGISLLSTQDTGMFREWSSDSNYLVESGSSSLSPLATSSNIIYRKIPTFIAPSKVYQTSWAMKSGFKLSWKLPVDLGFRYLVRFHFCELDYQIKEMGQRKFSLFINNQMAESDGDLIKWAGGHGVAIYMDYIMMMDGDRMEGKHDLLIDFYSNMIPELQLEEEEHVDTILKGLEVFKLSNNDKNLAGVNPVIPLSTKPRRFASPFSGRNNIFTLVVLLLVIPNIIVYYFQIYMENADNKIVFPCPPDEKVDNKTVFPSPPDEEKVDNKNAFTCPPDEKVDNKTVFPYPPDEKVDDKTAFPYPPDEMVENQIVFPIPYPPEELCRRFSLAELKFATNNFDDRLVIGRGGFGKVYKGNVAGVTKTVAIKRLSSNSKQGAEEFWTEIEIFSKLQHDHLVALIGYCDEHKEMILVYENMTRGSLADHLYKSYNDGKGRLEPLPWNRRLKLCIDAARGLSFLHESEPAIIHRDVKSTNILLDENWVAKISDFGLCRKFRFSHSCTHVSTSVKGTFGYLDPKYFLNGELTMKTDVYAFGVVLWEVLCGRPAIDIRFEDEQRSLALWAQSCFEDGILGHIVDPSLRGQIPVSSLKLISTIASQCLHNHLKKRPSMADIVSRLNSELDSLNNLDKLKVPEFGSWNDENDPRLTEVNYVPVLPQNLSKQGDIGGPVVTRSHVEVQLKIYSFNDMKRATQDFHNYLGQGGFGNVYRGWVNEKTLKPCKPGRGISVAIKKLDIGGMQGNEEWKAEVNVLGRISSRHPNLVKMFGYCMEKRQHCLVYEFVENGSLDKHLFTKGSISKRLSWDIRLKIAIGAAQGLAFLHTSKPSIIVRDVKSSNILLDKDYNAKLSDFGLAKDGPSDYSTHVSTRVVGTIGYAAPEYMLTGHLTTKSDVYCFGVLLLEIFTGSRVFDNNRQPEQQYLVDWAMPYLDSERIRSILDVQIEGQYSLVGAVKAGKMIQRCLNEKPKERPSMKEVVETLEEIAATVEGKTMSELHTTSESSPDGRSIHVDTTEPPTNAAKPKLSRFFSRLLFKSKCNLNPFRLN